MIVPQHILMVLLTQELAFSYVAVYAGSENSNLKINILICVPELNEGLAGLERHEGE